MDQMNKAFQAMDSIPQPNQEIETPQNSEKKQDQEIDQDTQNIQSDIQQDIPVQQDSQNNQENNQDEPQLGDKRKNPYQEEEDQQIKKQPKIDSNTEQQQQDNNISEQQEPQEKPSFFMGKIEKNMNLMKKQEPKQENNEDNGIITFAKDASKKDDDKEAENLPEKKIAPWVRSKTLRIQNPVLRLHNEIIEFTEYLQPTEKEHQLRTECYQNLVQNIKDVIPTCEVKSFGSFTTKLYLPNADIDMVVVDDSQSDKALYNKVAKMIMKKSDEYEQVQLISNAKVPIIKFVETSSQVNFDISINKLDGVKQLQEIEKALKIYPEMRYLIFILKCMLRQRDLHETFKGGIGSFLLFCMILAFLRELRRQYLIDNRTNEINSISLGEYVIRFFEFYGTKYDWPKKRIVMQEGGALIDKVPDKDFFSLISPQDSDHDIGSSAFKIRDVFNVFKNRYHFLTNFNFKKEESILKYLVNPSGGKFIFSKEDDEE